MADGLEPQAVDRLVFARPCDFQNCNTASSKLTLSGCAMSDSKEEQLLHYACANGIVMAAKRSITDSNQSNSNSSSILVCHAPFTVEPYPFPREAFATALAAGPLFNVLVDRIARDSQWLCKALKVHLPISERPAFLQ